MPLVHVPLSRNHAQHHSANDKRPPQRTTISYTTVGNGSVHVLLVPGLCVPSSMYDTMAAVLAATGQFTALLVDNRAMGRSEAPYSSFLGGAGYTISDFAADGWAVVDHFRANTRLRNASSTASTSVTDDHSVSAPSCADGNAKRRARSPPPVGLIGHSMGGMIVQHMFKQRPSSVRFLALLSTHAGGVWNLLPTFAMMRSVGWVALSGFDRDVNAAANLGLHFTQRFLDSWVVAYRFQEERRQIRCRNSRQGANCEQRHVQLSSVDEDELDLRKRSVENDLDKLFHQHSSSDKREPVTHSTSQAPHDPHARRSVPAAAKAAAVYWEARLAELAQEARIYFGLTASFVDGISSSRNVISKALARRREVYHARYTGADKQQNGDSSSSLTANPSDSSYALPGHAAVVRSHRLTARTAKLMKGCSRIVKLVMIGRHDQVVTPASSRALGAYIGANTVVEVEAAHFITDEAAAEVTTQVLYGLRKAFFARSACCECELCVPAAKVGQPCAVLWLTSLFLLCLGVGISVKFGMALLT